MDADLKNIDQKRKQYDTIQFVVLLLSIIPLFVLIWEYKQNVLTKEIVSFWFSVLLCPVFFLDGIFAHITGKSWAKGVMINKENTPFLFLINIGFSFLISAICFIGAIYFFGYIL